jgi:hypothetical protein
MLFLCTTFIEMVVHMMINHICYAPLEPLMRTVSKCTESFECTDANRDRCRPVAHILLVVILLYRLPL